MPEWAKVSSDQLAEAERLKVPVAFANALGLRFVLISAGTFEMGSGHWETERFEDEGPWHTVTLSKAYYLSITETSNRQYRRFDATHDSGAYQAYGLNDDSQPAVRVSHDDIVKYLTWMNGQDGTHVYRLPSEAEWEYACRAGTTKTRWWGDEADGAKGRENVLDSISKEKFGEPFASWFEFDDGFRVTAPVGAFAPNRWGLYDLLGNVMEWCGDFYDDEYYAASPREDPVGPRFSPSHVVRGGGWISVPRVVRCANRYWHPPEFPYHDVGFRVAASVGPVR